MFQVVAPGGCVLFRDYGLYDHAQLRFTPGHKLSENFYVRQDGTRAYYFSTGKCDSFLWICTCSITYFLFTQSHEVTRVAFIESHYVIF